MAQFVILHSARHTGKEFEQAVETIRAAGHHAFTPTLAGNWPGDSTRTGLDEAIALIVDYLGENDLTDIVLVGRSYGEMVITGVADRAPERIRGLVGTLSPCHRTRLDRPPPVGCAARHDARVAKRYKQQTTDGPGHRVRDGARGTEDACRHPSDQQQDTAMAGVGWWMM
jgi:pimeloyl-ACP methyl ester carboxylesterase